MPLGVIERLGGSLNPFEGMISRRVFTNSRGPPKTIVSSPGCRSTETSGFDPLFDWKRSWSNQMMMKPKRFTLKLVIEATASKLVAEGWAMGDVTTPFIVSTVGCPPAVG